MTKIHEGCGPFEGMNYENAAVYVLSNIVNSLDNNGGWKYTEAGPSNRDDIIANFVSIVHSGDAEISLPEDVKLLKTVVVDRRTNSNEGPDVLTYASITADATTAIAYAKFFLDDVMTPRNAERAISVGKTLNFITKASGVLDMIQDVNDIRGALNEGDWGNAALYTAKMGVDAFFTFNPAARTAKTIYTAATIGWGAYNAYGDLKKFYE